MAAPASPPSNDPETLKAQLVEAQAENERLRQIILAMQRHRFGRRAEIQGQVPPRAAGAQHVQDTVQDRV